MYICMYNRYQHSSILPADIKANLSPYEQSFFQSYNENLNDYNDIVDLDLTTSIQPPTSIFIKVRSTRDIGMYICCICYARCVCIFIAI